MMIATPESGLGRVMDSRRCAMRKYYRWMVPVVSLIFIGVATTAASLDEEVVLLSKEEAASLAARPPAGRVDVAAGLNDGPAIEMVAPMAGEEVQSPFRLYIRFTARNGKDVELGHLKVELVKALSFDITHRVMPYVSKDGIRIERVALPQGEFRFKVSLGDVAGGVSTSSFVVRVI